MNMRNLLFLLTLLVAMPAAAGPACKCAPADDAAVPYRVLSHRTSVHLPGLDKDNHVWHPDLSGVEGVPKKYLKCPGPGPYAEGAAIVEMTEQEKSALDLAMNPPPPFTKRPVYSGSIANRPACNADRRGALYVVEMTEQDLDDILSVCLMTSNNTGAWAAVQVTLP